MVSAAERELEDAGVKERPEVVLADAGYWSNDTSTRSGSAASPRSSPPTPTAAKDRERHASAGPTTSCEECSPPSRWRSLLTTAVDGRAGLRRDQAEPAGRALQTQRPGGRPLGMAPDRRHSQPPEAPPTHLGGRNGLIRARRPLPFSDAAGFTAGPRSARICATASAQSERERAISLRYSNSRSSSWFGSGSTCWASSIACSARAPTSRAMASVARFRS